MTPEQQCTAHKKNGDRCKRAANKGMNVCNSHGGRAPQVRRAAQLRILEASDKAAARLVNLMQDKSIPAAVQLNAARDLLDRANIVGTQQVNVSVSDSAWEKHMAEVVVDYVVEAPDQANVEDAVIVSPQLAIEAEDDELRALEARRLKRKRRTGSAYTLPSEEAASGAKPRAASGSTPDWYSPEPLHSPLRPLRPKKRPAQ